MSAKWNIISKIAKLNVKTQLPEKYNGTRIMKWYKSWDGLVQGYSRRDLISKIRNLNLKIELPEKYKGTILEKWYKYWEGLIQDYTRVFEEIVEESKARPLKASAYALAFAGGAVCLYTNPDDLAYKNQLIQYQNEFGLVGKPVRNPSADVYLKSLHNAYNHGLIRRFSLGFFSIIWLDNYDSSLGLYKAHCPYFKPSIINFHERIIDVGFFNKYWMMERKMIDYDVNPNEWIDFSKTEYGYRHRLPA